MQFNRQVNHLSIVSQNSADDDTCVTLTMDGMDREGNKYFLYKKTPQNSNFLDTFFTVLILI